MDSNIEMGSGVGSYINSGLCEKHLVLGDEGVIKFNGADTDGSVAIKLGTGSRSSFNHKVKKCKLTDNVAEALRTCLAYEEFEVSEANKPIGQRKIKTFFTTKGKAQEKKQTDSGVNAPDGSSEQLKNECIKLTESSDHIMSSIWELLVERSLEYRSIAKNYSVDFIVEEDEEAGEYAEIYVTGSDKDNVGGAVKKLRELYAQKEGNYNIVSWDFTSSNVDKNLVFQAVAELSIQYTGVKFITSDKEVIVYAVEESGQEETKAEEVLNKLKDNVGVKEGVDQPQDQSWFGWVVSSVRSRLRT